MDRSERRRQAKEDEKLLVRGIDMERQDPEPTAAMTRQLYSLVEDAKRRRNIDPLIAFLHTKTNGTTAGLRDVPTACRKGCAHCCHIWVSVTAPEALYVAKIVRKRGQAAIQKVLDANAITSRFDFDERDQHPNPCPLLQENVCSIYEHRPKACRLAVSADAEICARSYMNIVEEDIPTPVVFIMARSFYGIALAAALRRARLPYDAYEFNQALACALARDDAESAWLAGEDVFAYVRRDPAPDLFLEPNAAFMLKYAFEGH